jgi:hypothetical protein
VGTEAEPSVPPAATTVRVESTALSILLNVIEDNVGTSGGTDEILKSDIVGAEPREITGAT